MHREILKLIKTLSIFLLVASISYILLICFWGGVMPEQFKKNLNYKIGMGGNLFTRLNEVKNFGKVDIVFLGSSHAYRGFDPRVFKQHGYSSFNLGSSSQTPVQTLALTRRYIDILNPKIVIYEVYPGSFTGDGVESALDLIANDKNDFESLKMALKINHLKVYNTLIYGIFSDISGLNNRFMDTATVRSDRYISGGYVESDVKLYKHEKQALKNLEFKDLQFNAFDEICKELKNRNIRLILVEAPVGKEFYKAYRNKEIFNEKMKSTNEYYNFNDIMEVDDSLHFFDAHHLNQNGVELFNEKLIEIVLDSK